MTGDLRARRRKYPQLNFFAFDDDAANEAHRASRRTQQFVDRLYPNLVGDIEFKRYHLVATT